MNDNVRAILRDLPSRMRSEYVFPNRNGNPMSPDNFINRSFKTALKKAGIENFRWHDLRHTFASRLVMKGVPLTTVKELMGHKTIQMTLRYAHLSPSHLLEAVQQLASTTTDTRVVQKPERLETSGFYRSQTRSAKPPFSGSNPLAASNNWPPRPKLCENSPQPPGKLRHQSFNRPPRSGPRTASQTGPWPPATKSADFSSAPEPCAGPDR